MQPSRKNSARRRRNSKKKGQKPYEKKKLEFRKAAAADKDVSKNRSESSDLRPAITVRKQDKTMPPQQICGPLWYLLQTGCRSFDQGRQDAGE